MESNKLQRLKEILVVANQDVPSKKEVAGLISQIISAVKSAQALLKEEVELGKQDNNSSISKLLGQFEAFKGDISALVSKNNKDSQDKAFKLVNAEIYKLERAIKDIPEFDSGSLEAKWSTVVSEIQSRIDNIRPYIPQAVEIRDLLETLEGDERLDKKYIKGFEKLEEEIKRLKSSPTREVNKVIGAGTVEIYSGNTRVGSSQRLKFVGATVTNEPDGSVKVTVSGSSGGGTTPVTTLDATGTVDGVNQSFTFAVAPSVIVVDGGRSMRQLSKDGNINWTGTTNVTLQIAPNSDIFGF